jgi:DNA-binding CsgD family transcriptional regulator
MIAPPSPYVKADAISIVEAAYNCEADERTWVRGLLEKAAPRLDRGFGVTVSRYVPAMRPEESLIESRGMKREFVEAANAMMSRYPETFHRVLSSAQTLSSVWQQLGDDGQAWAAFVETMHPFGVRDIEGMLARDPSGQAIFMSAPASELLRTSPREAAGWSRIAAHISAGGRVRRAFPSGAPDGDLSQGAEAVLSPSGAVRHAEADAQSPSARESLRRAAKAIDRARSKTRSNEDEALDLWQGLVAGRWSLVEQFDSDGRRFMVARRNDPQVTDPRALSLRERQVLAYVAMGQPVKLIAYSLGVSQSSVSTTRRTAMRKLGLQTAADVVRLFAEAPPSEPSQER